MRLKLSIWAENLPCGAPGGSAATSPGACPNPFGVVAAMPPQGSPPGASPRVLGRTETLRGTASPDWTKFFVVEDFQMGQPYVVMVSVYDDDDEEEDSRACRRLLGSTLFDLGNVLGTPGGIAGKECGPGNGATTSKPILVLQVESSHPDLGTFHFRFGADGLAAVAASFGGGHQQPPGRFVPGDSYFELQRLRHSVRTGSRVWDCIFRSRPPCEAAPKQRGGGAVLWDESFVELDELCGGDALQPFRIAWYVCGEDIDCDNGHHWTGECRCSIRDLDVARTTAQPLRIVNSTGDLVGDLWVRLAQVHTDSSAPITARWETPDAERHGQFSSYQGEEDICVAPQSDLDPTFVNFMRGGCQLHGVVAVDLTASNGDPRKESSLHSFGPAPPTMLAGQEQPRNAYERALLSLCAILAQYDSDQQYPVLGFGARPGGSSAVSQCFPLDPAKPVEDGVAGILRAYREAFRSGIVMSSPRDYSAVIEIAASQARSNLDMGSQRQAYSILLIFTNGPPVDMNKSMDAIRRAMTEPISIVIVGVGGADFTLLEQRLSEISMRSGRDMVRFVRFQENQATSQFALTSAALDPIPEQLEAYFASRGILPNAPVEAEEIVVEPYRSDAVEEMEIPATGVPAFPVATAAVPYNPLLALSSTAIPVPNIIPVVPSTPVCSVSSSPHPTHPTAVSDGGQGMSRPSSNHNAGSGTINDLKDIGKKMLNSRVGRKAVGRLKGQARAKINQFTRQTIGFGIL